MLKDRLLNTIAEDNYYLDKLIDLVNANNSFPKKKEHNSGRELHHIIPRFYFKMEHLELDNSENNLVSLTRGQHFLIHYYTYMCCKKRFKCKAAAPVFTMFNAHKKEILKEFFLNDEDCEHVAKIIDAAQHK